MKINLFYKVFVTYMVVVAVAMIVVGFQGSRHIKTRLVEGIERDLVRQAEIINNTALLQEITHKADELARITESRITVINAEGTVLADSEADPSAMDNHINRTEIQEAAVKGVGSATRFSRTKRIDMLYVAVPVKDRTGAGGYLRLARPLSEIKHSINGLILLMIQTFILIGFLSFLLSFIFASRFVSPIQDMIRHTKDLEKGEKFGRLFIDSKDEMGQLARNINYIVSELENKVNLANEEKGKLEAALASMTDGVLILDKDDKIESLNAACERIMTVQGTDMIGSTPLEAFRNVDLQNAIDRFKEVHPSEPREISLDIEGTIMLDVRISPVRGLPDNEKKTMIVFRDVTRLKKLEKIRSDFVANVTHEIKTPLTAILGFVETLREGALEDKTTALKFLQTIDEHARRLDRLVNDLLTISAIELGEKKLTFESVSVKGIIESVVPLIELRAGEKGITIKKDIADNLGPVKGDRDSLGQILLNVLDNAVKFTPKGGTVSITASNVDENIAVRIEDTGIGIPKNEISRLGERFYRVDKMRSRAMGGTGLGLSIVKHLMEAHRGKVMIQSQLGRGTIVTLFLPRMKEHEST
jgi:two-component system phosphate regulon sensor histidine kinase PhoR